MDSRDFKGSGAAALPSGGQGAEVGRSDARLVAAYRQTTFSADTSVGEVQIRPGGSSKALDRLLAEADVESWAHITACNPGSRSLSDEENLQRNDELRRSLEAGGLRYFPGAGRGDDGWTEPGFLVLGLSREDACSFGAEFGQNAIVFGVRGQPAELVLMDPDE